MYKDIFFDLDGTLLGMDEEKFLHLYFKYLLGFAYKNNLVNLSVDLIEEGTAAMVLNDGSKTNEEMFWEILNNKVGYNKENHAPLFDKFYLNDFEFVKESCYLKKEAKEIIDTLISKGYNLYLTTNPIFPKIATFQRIKWAGLNKNDFRIVTTYENCHYSKPNLKYYQEVIDKFKLNNNEILMIGNDVLEDGIIQKLNIDCYLVTDSLINRKNLPLDTKYMSDIKGLLEFVKSLPKV